MAAKPTLSRDGEFRFTLNVSFRVGRLDLIHCLCCHLAWRVDGTPESPWPSSRAAILSVARKFLEDRGSDVWACAEDVEQRYKDAAQDLVDKHFPELKENRK